MVSPRVSRRLVSTGVLAAALCSLVTFHAPWSLAAEIDLDGDGVLDTMQEKSISDARGLEHIPETNLLLAVCWDGDDSLVGTIDMDSGDWESLGGSGLPRLNSLAANAAGVFFTVTKTEYQGISSLATVDPSTGSGTIVEELSPILYAIADKPDRLYTIDTTTGVARLVGDTGFPGVQGLAYSPTANVLYGWDIGSGSGVGDGLVIINPATGAATDVGPAEGTSEIQGLTVLPNGIILGARDSLWQVDPDTGEASPAESIAIDYRYLVGAVAHSPGLGDTLWRTDVAAVVTGDGEANLNLIYRSGEEEETRTASLDAGATVEWGNVLETLFGISPWESSAGSLEIVSTQPLTITSRTYNQGDTGTFGQYLPALTATDALGKDQVGILPQLKKTENFRTNIGAVNIGSKWCEVRVRLHDATGAQVGSSHTLRLKPHAWTQQSDIFDAVGAGPQEVAYATVQVQTGGCMAWVYASVVDAETGDPTTVPVIVPVGVKAAPCDAHEHRPALETGSVRWPSAMEPAPGSHLGPGELVLQGAASNQYEGTWAGTTSQGKTVAFHVNSSGVVDDFAIELRLDVVSYYCTGFASTSEPFALDGSSISTTVYFPASNITSEIDGAFSSSDVASGSYSGFSGSFMLVCGSYFTMGTASLLSDGTWQASRAGDVVASASAEPTSGQAPIDVHFTGLASGGVEPYSYHWDFGDTFTSSAQSPTHTYTIGGAIVATFTVTDTSGGTASASVTLELDPPPPVQASASADVTSGPAPLTVSFSGSAWDGAPPYSYSWDFGDGSEPGSGTNPVHTYQSADEFLAVLTVTDLGNQSATASVPIIVGRYRYMVPAVAHTPGTGDTLWRTDIGCVNPGLDPASFSLVFANAKSTHEESLAAGAATEWANIVETVFGVSPSTSTSGSVEILSDRPLVLSARTYNDTPDGTFGQYLPALTEADALTYGQIGVLPQLKNSGNFRTNVGAVNLGQAACTVRIRMYGASGDQVGNEKHFSVPPGEWVQQNDVFAFTSSGIQDIAYATVEVVTQGGLVWLYGSVVDGGTGDPTTIPLLLW